MQKEIQKRCHFPIVLMLGVWLFAASFGSHALAGEFEPLLEEEGLAPLLLDIIENTDETDGLRLEVLAAMVDMGIGAGELAPAIVEIIGNEEESDDLRLGVIGEIKAAGPQIREKVLEEENSLDALSGIVQDQTQELLLRVAAHGALEEFSAEPVYDFRWRSRYYPEDWEPGYSDEEGRFLHDFSYAGYHMGERPLPDTPLEPVVDATESPYNADPEGERDSTEAIQRALDDVGRNGGGTVYLPEGTYRVEPPGEEANESLLMQHSGVVLRGDGPEETRIYNSDPVMRQRSVIRVQSPDEEANWREPVPDAEEIPILGTVEAQSAEIPLEHVDDVEEGQWVVLKQDVTEEFVDEHPGAPRVWVGNVIGPTFFRRLTDVCEEGPAVTIDIPLRYDLKSRDNARLYRVGPHIDEVGVEDLSIGMQEHPGNGFANADYNKEGTAGYEVHGAHVISVRNVVNGWIRRVHTYRPPSNEGPHHIVSNGIQLLESRGITVSECELRHAQYRGYGGNGYGYILQSNDCLVQDCYGGDMLRYVYDFKQSLSNGNVIHRSVDGGRTGGGPGSSDFHMHLSPANLIDNLEMLRGAWFNASSRGGAGTIAHALTTNQSVFWNTRGMGGGGFLIDVSRQSGRTFIIGTRGERTGLRGLASDHRGIYFEGEGLGEKLEPESLYEDQLRRRTR